MREVRLGRSTLEDARSALSGLNERLTQVAEHDAARLQREYQRLLRGLRDEGIQYEEEAVREEDEPPQQHPEPPPQADQQQLVPVTSGTACGAAWGLTRH